MSNAMTLFDQGGGALPAHIQQLNDELGSNITEGVKVPSLSYEGKIWSVSKDGNKEKLMRRNEDGDDEPLAVMRVVIAAYNPRRGRAFYEGSYDPGNVSAPVCWSDDGKEPDSSIAADKKKSLRCDTCPQSVKGSRVTDSGKETVACASHRMLAVLPVKPDGQIIIDPLRMKIAITSDWDAQSPEQEANGWRSFQKYTEFLKSRGVGHTAAVVTKMKFDPNVAYPKIFFSPERFLQQNEVDAIKATIQGEEVQKLLAGTYTPVGTDGVEKEQTGSTVDEIAPAPAVAPDPAPAPAPAAEMVIDAAPAPAPEPVAATPAPAPEQSPPASTAVPAELEDLLSEWAPKGN